MNNPSVNARIERELAAARDAQHACLRLSRQGRHEQAAFAREYRDSAMRCARSLCLARANGCDQPVRARESCPITPAAGERVCHVVAAGRKAGDTSACVTLQRPVREGVL